MIAASDGGITMPENQNFHPHPHYRAPCMNMLGAPKGRFMCAAPENLRYRGTYSGGGWGNSGSIYIYIYIYIYI